MPLDVQLLILLVPLLPMTIAMQDVHANHPIINCSHLETLCFCSFSENNYELQCPSSDVPSVLVKYTPNEFLDIDCLDNPSRNLFSLPDIEAQGIRKLSFRNCSLPPDGLGNITDKFALVSLDLLKVVVTNFENVTLTSGYFGEIRRSLRQLNLEGNGLESIPYDTFEGMENLLALDLNSNLLTELSAKYFRYVPNVQEMDLSRNVLESIAEDAFEGLTQLRRLHLWSNHLKTLSSRVFSSLTSLQSLELSINDINYLPDGVFHQLESLKQINLRSNNISALQENLFERNKNLATVRFDSNKYLETLPGGLFANLSALAEVQVCNCGLRELPGDLFRGSNNLTSLLLHRNNLTSLPNDLFLGLEHLQHLELQQNHIETITEKLLEPLYALKTLDLSSNSLTTLELASFRSLASLEELFLRNNNIRDIEGRFFIGVNNLRVLDLSNNKMTLLQSESPATFFTSDHELLFQNLFKLEELFLGFNKIVNFQMSWLMNKSNFKRINLENNHVNKLEYISLQTTSVEKEVYVNLQNNHISAVDFSGASVLADVNPNSTAFVVQLAGNPWQCDCNLYDLLRYFKLELDPRIRARVELVSNDFDLAMTCRGPREYRDKIITDLPLSSLTCPLVAPRDITTCPNPCTCHYRPFGHAVIVDCVQRNLTDLPPIPPLPQSTAFEHSVDQDGEEGEGEPMIADSGILRVVDLGWNGNGSTAGGSLEVWAQGNRIQRVTEVQGYDRVAVLDVSGCGVREVQWLPPRLKLLKLHNNNVQELSDEILNALNETANVTLDNNPWKCNCDALGLSNFLRDHFIDMNIRCNRTGLLLRKLTQSELCPSNTVTILLVSLSVLLPLLLCAFLAAFYYRYQRAVKVFLFAHPLTQWLVTQEDLDRGKVYDAFMCYAHEDEDYVEQILKELEGGEQPYKVCIHRRDWMPGVMIANQINDSVRQSRRTIVVLSPAFVRSEWARMEFRTAHASDLKEGRARLIVILLGNLDPKVLEEDEELRAYCSTKTYLKHDDPMFWQKLRYAMPHRGFRKPLPSGGKVSRLGQIMVNIERQDLCATPTTPNPGSTPPAHALGLGTEETLLRRLAPLDFLVKSGKIGGTDEYQTTATA